MATEAKNTNYWISSTALYIQLNSMGEPDYIQCSVVSGASVLCYMSDVPGLGYDAGHNYQRWTLAAYPSIFPDSERKYVYIAIPRQSTTDNNQATVVFPGEKIDIYGKTIPSSGTEGVQIGNEAYYYIFTGGIISAVKTDADNTRKREWEQHFDCGKLATDEAIASGGEGAWWRYNSVSDTITFLKEILKANFNELSAKVARVTSLFLGGHELKGVADSNGTLETSNDTVVTPHYLGQFGVKHFLAKDKDDTAYGTITWEKVQKFFSGLLVGNSNNENGGSWTTDAEGRSHLNTDYLEVRMKAIFEELVINKTSTIGGKEIISPAGGVVAHKVEEVTVTYNNVSQKAYRCYFLAEQEGDAVDNDFAVGDQVRSESFNVRKGTYHKAGNHFYWRLVIGRDEEPVELEGKKYHYIDLSDTDCATASDVPAKGDVLNQCGNRTDVERQNCLIFSAVDTYSPSISLYHGINSYSFANREYVEYGVNKQTNKAFFNVYGDMYVGDRPTKENGYEGSSYIRYDSSTKQMSVKAKISAKSTVDGKELSQYFKKIADLQNQVDGAIETWFYDGVPTLENAPAISWKTDKDKEIHLGDLYYDNKTGKAYRFAKDSNTYKWTIITDTDIAKALSDARMAQETANGKMKVFSVQPTTPYQVGDIWVNATYPSDGSTYKNEVLRCQTNKAAVSQFAIGDWIKASKYTDDTVANAAKKAAENAQKAAQTAQTDIKNLGKTVTDNKKEFDNYVTDGYLEPSEIAAMAQDSKRLEDDFAAAQKSYNEVKEAEVLTNTKELTDLNTAFATLTSAKTELVTYLSEISTNYNKADTTGKATIVSAVGTKFTNFQSAYSAFYDKLGLANAYITRKIYGDLGVVIGDVSTYQYLKKVLADGVETEINGGLILTSLIALRDHETKRVESGINGVIDKTAKGNGIATWWGGYMNDGEVVGFDKKEDYSKQAATSLVRFDGSGYMANGAIWWGTDGKVHADPTSFIISEKNLGAYLTFFEPTWKEGSAGTSVADLVSLKPNAPFSKLGVSGDATFEGAISFHGIKLTYDSTNKAIKIDGNLYTTGGITAYGAGASTTGGGGLIASVISYARILEGSYTDADLTSIPNAYAIKALSSRIDNIATELGGLNLSWNNITGKPSTFTPSAHTHKWTEITDRITKVSQLTNDKGYLTAHQSLASYYTKAEIDAKGYTTNKGTVTSVALTLPTGLTCATKTITTSGTFAISLASGYSIPTTAKQTAWDGAVSAKHTHSNKSVLDGITSTKVTCWDSAYDWYALITTDEETADGVINKWNEVVSFLANIAQTDTLSGIVDGINKSISDEVTRAKKAEGVNASGISTNKTSITTLQGYFTSGSAKKALQLTNTHNLWGNSFNGTADINGSIIVPDGKYISIGNIKMEYDATNKALKITNTTTNEVANLYTSGGVSAYGVGTSSSSGGGLNGSVKSYSNALKLTSESLSEIASAYSIKALDSRISSLEGGSATAISVSGSGNAVTSVTKDGTTISVVKGSTFLTSHQSLDGYVNAISVSGSGNAITSVSKSGKGITFTKGATFLTSHQSLANYYTKSSVDSLLSGKSATSHTHSVKINGVTKTIAATGGTAVDLGTYLTSHQSLADYAKKSEIPTVGNGVIVINQAGSEKGRFTVNQSGSTTINLTDNNSTYNFSGASFVSGNSNNGEHNANNITYNSHTYYTSNGPSKALGASTDDGSIYSQAYSSTWVSQIAQDYRNGRLFVRGKNNNVWQSWKRIAQYEEIPTTLPANGGNSDTVDGYHASGLLTALSNSNNGISLTVGGTIKYLNNIQVYSATKLVTSRNISIGGKDFVGNANFDGSGNIILNGAINHCTINIGSTDPNPYKRVAHIKVSNSWNDNALLLYINQGYNGGKFGLCRVDFRTNDIQNNDNAGGGVSIRWLIRSGYSTDSVQAGYYIHLKNAYVDVFVKTTGAYQGTVIRVIQDSRGSVNNYFSLINSSTDSEAYTSLSAAAIKLYNIAYQGTVSGYDDGVVKYSNSTSNADMVDYCHVAKWNGLPIVDNAGVMEIGKYIDFHNTKEDSVDYSTRIVCTGVHKNIVNLPSVGGTLALTSDNVASATKLAAARTIWGQSFDGTGNVDGTLRIRNTTSNYCEGIRIQTSDGAWSTIILGATADSGTNANAWSIHRKNDNNFSISRNSPDGLNGLVMTSVGMGLGTTAPAYRLDVRGDIYSSDRVIANNSVLSNKLYSSTTPDITTPNKCIEIAGNTITEYHLEANSSPYHSQITLEDTSLTLGAYSGIEISAFGAITLKSMGAFTITYRNAKFTVEQNGSEYAWKMNSIKASGNILATGGITAYSSSDIRLKQDLRKLDYFGIIKAMGGTYGFAWKKDNTRSIGWIAQHVLCNPHLKDIVETDEKGYYKINYWSPKLIATAFGAIEQVGDEVSRLKARVVFLESEVLRLSGDKEDCNKKRLDNKNINLLN